MEGSYCIAMDVHSRTCEVLAATPRGRVRARWSLPTTIPALRKAVESVPRPRTVVLEEGPMAQWITDHLRPQVDEVVVCDPRRNHLVANDGDKDDPIDVEKLLRLHRGGFLRRVHHPEARRADFKARVRLYHDRVRHRVAEGNRVIWFVRHAGIVITSQAFGDAASARTLLQRLPARRRSEAMLLLRGYRSARAQERRLEASITRTARRHELLRRFEAVPGIGWIRGATFYTCVDTPWRFRSKQALWKYLGIGLERSRSGSGPTRYRLPRQCNRMLKNVILGAAHTAVSRSRPNPFADRYQELIAAGHPRATARRTVARSLAAVMWSMWKSQTTYHPEWIGLTAAELTALRCGTA